MKEFHIINVGASIVTNYQRSLPESDEIKHAKLSDNKFWKSILDDHRKLNEIYDFVKKEPKKNSAELNSFLRKIEGFKNLIEVYFTGTKTPVNEICVTTIERYLKDLGFTVYTTKEFPGYFLETYIGEDRVSSFIKGISEMVDHLIKIARKKKEEGYKVFFNPTGGFKAHVIAMALAGFMTYCEVYYLHEEFSDLITFPPLFYIPEKREKELLEILSDEKPRSGKDCDDLINKYPEEFDRLLNYGLIFAEKDDTGKIFRIKIFERGKLFLRELNKI